MKKVRKDLERLNDEYFSLVNYKWEEQGFSDYVYCYKKGNGEDNFDSKVPFLKGIDLLLAHTENEKHIFLRYVPIELEYIVKKYIRLKGFSDKNVELLES